MNSMLRNFLIVFVALLLFSNCAKKGAPSGGPKDSIPPIIIRSNPENYSINFNGDEIRIYFDEYIKLKDLQQNLIISPPLEYQPIITPLSTSKVLKIKILDTLKPNTTYSFNFKKRLTRFAAEEIFTITRPEVISNKHILLVDDIVTTGATLENCAQQLLKSPDVKLSVATIAIA